MGNTRKSKYCVIMGNYNFSDTDWKIPLGDDRALMFSSVIETQFLKQTGSESMKEDFVLGLGLISSKDLILKLILN